MDTESEIESETEATLVQLFERAVIEETPDSDALMLTDTFEATVAEHRSQLRELDAEPKGGNRSGRQNRDEKRNDSFRKITATKASGDAEENPPTDVLVDLYETDPTLLATYLALTTHLDDLVPRDRLQLLPLLAWVGSGPHRAEGAPDVFLPIDGAHLPAFLPLFRRVIVYIWRDDCPPCEMMREELDRVFVDPTPDIELFAVYGPDAAELLYDEYDVHGGPTTLFVIDGHVDTRLQGAHHRETIESEVELLRKLS